MCRCAAVLTDQTVNNRYRYMEELTVAITALLQSRSLPEWH